MGLVNYSDSETSDVEDASAPSVPPKQQPHAKPAFQKVTHPSEPRKIKVELPSLQPGEDASTPDEGPPSKKARTAGTFGGFNSMLPAPKRSAAQSAPKAGVSLRTSSEAAFSRAPPSLEVDDSREEENWSAAKDSVTVVKAEEPKIVGKATKFKPLSVANNKNKKPVVRKDLSNEGKMRKDEKQPTVHIAEQLPKTSDPPPPKPKRSLFSVPQDEERPEASSNGTYEPLISDQALPVSNDTDLINASLPSTVPAADPNSLQSLTADMNLTAAQKRQLFGRHAKSGDVNITHFNMENEYAANEQLRQAGEVFEHRAVKAIAPGKHSLQQLVNNARSQQDAMEDKWADGRRSRGQGEAKYGWGK